MFDNWASCQESIKGFSGADYKSFNTKEEAEAYINDVDIFLEAIQAVIEQDMLLHFVMVAMIGKGIVIHLVY